MDANSKLAAAGRRIRAEVVAFHNDEEGLSTVEMLLLLLIGVVILAALVKLILPGVWDKIHKAIDDIMGWTPA